MDTFNELISRNFSKLSTIDKQIYQVIQLNIDQIDTLTLQAISEQAYTSKSSVHRFIHKLGFEGFSEFKYHIMWHPEQSTESLNNDLGQFIHHLTNKVNDTLLTKVAAYLSHAQAIFLLATGNDQYIQAQNFSRQLLKMGLTSTLIPTNADSELTRIVLDNLKTKQLLIVFSTSGDNLILQNYLETALKNKTSIIAFTVQKDGWLQSVADLTIALDFSLHDSGLSHYSSGLMHLLLIYILENITILKRAEQN